MSSFPFVRHHFLRSGFEIIDCPPLTAQLKNSADIRMVMDIRDLLSHDTYFDEFIILSGDADFTPVLHRLRSHARRTVIYANDNTAAPYTAICDGEVRERDFLALLRQGHLQGKDAPEQVREQQALPSAAAIEVTRKQIMSEVVSAVRAAGQPVPLEALADRAVRILGHDKTVGSGWGGVGNFRDLLAKGLPREIRLSDQAPYYVFDTARAPLQEPKPIDPRTAQAARSEPPRQEAQVEKPPPQTLAPLLGSAPPAQRPAAPPPGQTTQVERGPLAPAQPDALSGQPGHPRSEPPRAYRALFEVMAQEISANGLAGSQTLANIVTRAQEFGIEIRGDDARFVLDVVSEADPWFDQGASASLFASRFRNFVVARCRSQGLNLSAGELDLIEAWFAGPTGSQRGKADPAQQQGQTQAPRQPAPTAETADAEARSDQSWSQAESRQRAADPDMPGGGGTDEFPRIIRTRLRG
jgi:hypothetical protein